MKQLDSENADRDLTSLVTVLTHTPSATVPMRCQALIKFGDGTKNLDGTGGDFEVVITVGGQTLEPSPQVVTFSTAVRAQVFTAEFPVPANTEVVVKALSPNAADTDVDVTAVIYDVESVTLADDSIKAATFDESTAYPLKSADTGATALARTGEDSDTLETLSDQIDGTAQTSALPANFSSLAIDSDGCVSADIVKIRGSELAAKILAARNYAYMDDQVVTVVLEADDTDAEKGTKLAAAYAAAKLLAPGGNAISSTNRVKVRFPVSHYDMGTSGFTLDTNGIDLFAMEPAMGGRRKMTDCDRPGGLASLDYFRPSPTLIYTSEAGKDAIIQSASDVRMHGFSVAQLGTSDSPSAALYVTAEDNDPSVYMMMYFWHRYPYPNEGDGHSSPVKFVKHIKGTWDDIIANSCAWMLPWDLADEAVMSVRMRRVETGSRSIGGDYPSGHKGAHKLTNCYLEDVTCIGGQLNPGMGYASISGCGNFANDIDSTCIFVRVASGPNSYGIGAKNEALMIDCRGEQNCAGGSASNDYPGEFAGTDIRGIFGPGSLGGSTLVGVNPVVNGKCTGTLIDSRVIGSKQPHRLQGVKLIRTTLTTAPTLPNFPDVDCITLLDSNSRISNSSLEASGTGKAVNAASALSFAGGGNHYGGGLGANVTNTGTGDEATLTAAYDHAKDDVLTPLAVVDGNVDSVLADTAELQTNQGNWLTATGFSTHAAADVVTALGTGSTLTDCATADVSGIPAAVKEAMEAAGSTLAAIVEDTGTTLPAAISEIEAGTGGTVDVDIDVEDIIVE